MDTASTSSFNSTASESDSIKIFLRVRPPEPSVSENDFAPRVLDVNTADNAVILRTKPDPKVFTYDNVADADITQEAVFSTVGKKLIESCVAGYNGTIFAYGQTGSGKTFTMLGPTENSDSFQHELRGVIPRSFEYLFSLIAHQQELHGSKKQFLCKCSFLEIYQEQIFDLLDTASQGLHLRENMNKGVFVDGLIEQVICNPTDAYQVLVVGMLNRRVAGTSMNRESSRSHAVFTVTIESKEDIDGVQNIRTSQLNLVDLAGSERQKDTNTGGTRLKEAGSINKSLSVLGNVIMSLVDISHGKKRHIPYRDSKLTFLLRDSLGGNTKTRMIACVHPDSRCFGETLSTLNFARSAKLIKNKAVVNEDFHGNNQKLQNEIRRLKEIVESLQNNLFSPSAPLDKQSLFNADSVWKTNFIDAMYFREQSESEKKALQDVVNHLQELCNKKDKYIQSTKMIIKFRENTIQSLRQSAENSYAELEKDSFVKSLQDEIRELRQQVENNPMFAKFAGENKHLRNELKRLRARESMGNVHSSPSKVADLESTFKELKLYKDLSTGSPCGQRASQLKDGMTPKAFEKYKRECKEFQEQIEKLKHMLLDVTKSSESRQMAMEVELVSRQKTITELERVLEAHQLKARIECNALKDLHCQTLKVMTTPKASNTSQANQNRQTPGDVSDTEPGLLECMAPTDLAAGAHDALMEEINSLQMKNTKLDERIDEYESDLRLQRQQVEKLESFNTQLMGVLEKERAENTVRRNDYTNAVNTLNEEIDTVKNDLKLLNEENTDLHLVLKSADKQLREEKEKHKVTQSSMAQELQACESKLLKANLDLETTTRDYEEALKELGSVKEELEMARVTTSFIESHALELEELRNREIKRREKLEQEYNALQTSSGDYHEYKTQAQANLDQKEAQLEQILRDKAELSIQLELRNRTMEENKEMISTLMGKLQEMKLQQSEFEESRMSLQAEVDNYSQELEEAKRDLEAAAQRGNLLQTKLDEEQEATQQKLQCKEFEISNMQEDYASLESINVEQNKELGKLRADTTAKELRIMELIATENDLKAKLNMSEQARRDAKLRYEESLRQAKYASESSDGLQKVLKKKDSEIENLHDACDKQNKLLAQFENAQIELKKENDNLKLRVEELQKSKEELHGKRVELEDLQFRLSTAELNNKEYINSLKSSLAEKDEQILEMQQNDPNLNGSFAKMQQDYEEVLERSKSLESDRNHYQQEVQRLQTTLSDHYEERVKLLSQSESFQEEKTKLNTELQSLREINQQLVKENSQYVGHSNQNQKIHLYQRKAEEYYQLQLKYHDLETKFKKLMEDTGRSPAKNCASPGAKRPASHFGDL